MSFLRDYTTFTSGNESPAIYHTWAGLSALSSLVSFKVWTDQGPFILRPNLYVVLVGNPGIKKTTAMNFAKRLIREFPDIPIAPASITKEALTEYLGEKSSPCKKAFIYEGKTIPYSHISIYANELVTLLDAGGNPIGMIRFLTDIWDQPEFEVKTKNKGCDKIPNPFVTILGCLTPELMANMLFQRIISGGFSRRCIFVYADRNERPHPRLELSDEQKLAWDNCIAAAKRITKIQGQFLWTPEAIEVYDTWYYRNFDLRENPNEDKVFRGYLNSKAEFVIKIAMLVAISESEELIFLPEHFDIALAFLEQTEPGFREIFGGTGRNPLGLVQAPIEALINNNPSGVMVKEIYRRFRPEAQVDEIASIINHLQKAGIVELFSVSLKDGRPPIEMVGPPGAKSKFEQERLK